MPPQQGALPDTSSLSRLWSQALHRDMFVCMYFDPILWMHRRCERNSLGSRQHQDNQGFAPVHRRPLNISISWCNQLLRQVYCWICVFYLTSFLRSLFGTRTLRSDLVFIHCDLKKKIVVAADTSSYGVKATLRSSVKLPPSILQKRFHKYNFGRVSSFRQIANSSRQSSDQKLAFPFT